MESFIGTTSPTALAVVITVALVAGIVKGVVGFAMPMILISGMTFVLPPESALAALILPTLITNLVQALRQGLASAIETIKAVKLLLIFGGVILILSAQLVRILDVRILYALIGAPVASFALMQLAGWTPGISKRTPLLDGIVGSIAGFFGGLSGVWGPPTVLYLTAANTPKEFQMRAQGVIYGLGAIALAGAHIQTGVVRAETLPLTILILPFALIGLWIGFQIQDRTDQKKFKKITLIVLAVVGLNLLRRALLG